MEVSFEVHSSRLQRKQSGFRVHSFNHFPVLNELFYLRSVPPPVNRSPCLPGHLGISSIISSFFSNIIPPAPNSLLDYFYQFTNALNSLNLKSHFQAAHSVMITASFLCFRIYQHSLEELLLFAVSTFSLVSLSDLFQAKFKLQHVIKTALKNSTSLQNPMANSQSAFCIIYQQHLTHSIISSLTLSFIFSSNFLLSHQALILYPFLAPLFFPISKHWQANVLGFLFCSGHICPLADLIQLFGLT